SASNITQAGNTPETVIAVYTDNVGVNHSSIEPVNIVVTPPSGLALNVESAGAAPGGNGPSLSASYVVDPPAGGWSPAANGTYTVTLLSNQVEDTSGNFAASTTTQFNV